MQVVAGPTASPSKDSKEDPPAASSDAQQNGGLHGHASPPSSPLPVTEGKTPRGERGAGAGAAEGGAGGGVEVDELEVHNDALQTQFCKATCSGSNYKSRPRLQSLFSFK